MKPVMLIQLALLASCAAAPKPEPAVIEPVATEAPAPPPPSAKPVAKSKAVVDGGDIRSPNSTIIATLPPDQIPAAAAAAKADASSYVIWKSSKPDNIDRLANLVAGLDASVATMRSHAVSGKYPAADVLDAREKLRELRLFLSVKDD
jgi:hypothetical protein